MCRVTLILDVSVSDTSSEWDTVPERTSVTEAEMFAAEGSDRDSETRDAEIDERDRVGTDTVIIHDTDVPKDAEAESFETLVNAVNDSMSVTDIDCVPDGLVVKLWEAVGLPEAVGEICVIELEMVTLR